MDAVQSLASGLWPLVGLRRQPQPPTPSNEAPAGRLVPWFSPQRSAQVADAVAYLNAHCPVIRVGLEDAMGLGHQSASVHVACRLRALGYRGAFEIVASEHSLGKIETLWHSVGEPVPRVVSVAEAASIKRLVGVTGGWGKGAARQTLNVHHCLLLQPLQWRGARAVIDADGATPLRVGPYAGFRYDAVPTPPIMHLIRKDMSAVQGASLLQIVRSVAQGRSALMVIYGLHHLDASHTREMLRQISRALASTADKTICLVVNAYETPCEALSLDRPADLAAALGPGGPRVVQVAAKQLPEPVFRGLYAISTLPPILEGANTTNFMRVLGRPYLSVRTRDTPYPGLWGYHKVRKTCEDIAAMLGGRVPFDEAVWLDFLAAARTPNSQVRRYFSALGDGVRAPESDQVARGLVALRRSMLRRALNETPGRPKL